MQKNSFHVLVIGAGATGLIAALEIALTGRTVAVLEAKAAYGGRMSTVYDESYPIELGAEFVHGKLPLTLDLLKKAGLKTTTVKGSMWQRHDGQFLEQQEMIEDYNELEKKFSELKGDCSVEKFLSSALADKKYQELRDSLQNYVEGYYAADPSRVSAFALRDELAKSDEEQYRTEGGYQLLTNYLEQECNKAGVRFFFSEPVLQLSWRHNSVEATTQKTSYTATKALITVSIGVLQTGGITFSPALPEKTAAAQKLGFGHVVKITFIFKDAFWKDTSLTGGRPLNDLSFLFSGEEIPTWWTQHPNPKPALTAWLGGPKAKALRMSNTDDLVRKTLHALSLIFSIDFLRLSQMVQSTHFYNWSADEHICGAYSYDVVNGSQYKDTILQPAVNTLFFAGEGLYKGVEIGTVEAALVSGRNIAHDLIASF